MNLWNTASPWEHQHSSQCPKDYWIQEAAFFHAKNINISHSTLQPGVSEGLSRAWRHSEGPCFYFKQDNNFKKNMDEVLSMELRESSWEKAMNR